MSAIGEIARKHITIALCLIVLMTTSAAQAEVRSPGVIYAEGVAAVTHGDRDGARQKALADALDQASLSIGAHVMATDSVDSSEPSLQSQQIRAIRQVSEYAILREWEDGAGYHVAISAEGDTDVNAEKDADSTRAVRKKIAFLRFHALNTVQLDDIRDIYSELPREISRRMEANGGVLASYVDGSIPGGSDSIQRETVMQIARDTGTQFLISGVIHDAGIYKKQSVLGLSFGNRRHFKVEVVAHDGLTGAKLFSRNLEADAQGDVVIGGDKPFGGGAFSGTDSGLALNRLISAAATDIHSKLACLPLSANVVRVEGKSAYLDAGAVSMLRKGDKLALYNTAVHSQIVALGGSSLGMLERPTTTVTLVRIQPMFSVGELPEEAGKLGVKPGSIARLEFSEKGLDSPVCLQ